MIGYSVRNTLKPSALWMESYETRLSDGVESVVRMDRRSPLRHAFEVVHGLLSIRRL
ncbi:MAG UNVERIFIED_CONTAM: hypothetical protein LVT10_26465 [Anaerolineae bacterium]